MKKNIGKKALSYYKIGFQFLNSSKLLLQKMIEHKNIDILISETEISEQEFNEATKYSDFNIIIPILFNYYQGIELILKGALANKNELQQYTHNLEEIEETFKEIYSYDKILRDEIIRLIDNPIPLIKVYKNKNEIISGKELYNSLRYPNNKNKTYDYSNLIFNSGSILDECKEMINNIDNIKMRVVGNYREN